jgi:hypothetical protein
MPAALTPDLALTFLRELSADITAVIVLDAAGRRLAGPPALHAPARDLLAAAPPGPAELHGRAATGAAFAARDGAHQIVVATGPLALPGLTRHDLRTALAALRGATMRAQGGPMAAGREMPPIEAPGGAVERLIAASQGRL